MSKIDWDKPLENKYGEVKLLVTDGFKAQVDLAECMSYWVYMESGKYVGAVLDESFTVRNKVTNRDRAYCITRLHSMTLNTETSDDDWALHLVDALIEAGLLREDG